jgi:hypothetical protein
MVSFGAAAQGGTAKERYQNMNATTAAASALRPRAGVPLPWQAFYEFGRHICVGCAVTFGPRSAPDLKPVRETTSDTPHIKLILVSEGKQTEPLMRELPKTKFEPQALAVLIADAIADAVTSTAS